MKPNDTHSTQSEKVASPRDHQENIHIEQQSYINISNSSEFHSLLKKKTKFILPMTIFFLAFYFILPLLTSYTEILHQKAIGDITWVWVFALAQFIMVWTLAMLYVAKANSFDKDADTIVTKAKRGDYQ